MAYEAQRVAQGAALLDRVEPGWYDRIDLGVLRVRDACKCVCGQLGGETGEFYDGYSAALFDDADSDPTAPQIRAAHGFLADRVNIITATGESQHPVHTELGRQCDAGLLTHEEWVQLAELADDCDVAATATEYARLDTLWTGAILRRRARDRYTAEGYGAVIVDETLAVGGKPGWLPIPAAEAARAGETA